MKTNVYRFLRAPSIMILGLILFLAPVRSVAQSNIDIAVPASVIPLKLQMNTNISPDITIGVLNAGAPVFWEFGILPPGAVTTQVGGFTTAFQSHGVLFTLPAGVSGTTPVAVTAKMTINQTPTTPGSFSFTVQLSDGTNNTTATVEVFITKKLDIVLVLDRSGSMGTTISGTTTRWIALKNAAVDFTGVYQALNRPDDRLSITYFESGLTPVSACCNTFIPVGPSTGTTVTNDLTANNPGSATAMGTGLKNAQTKLSADLTRARSVFLLTDGLQNVPPDVVAAGDGYSDDAAGTHGIPGPGTPTSMRIYTVGFESPGPTSSILQNIATHTGGTYFHTDTGLDLGDEFLNALTTILSDASPQLISRSSTNVVMGAPPVTLQTFPVNNKVEKLILEFEVGRSFEVPQLFALFSRIKVAKGGTPVLNYAKPSWIGNFTNKIFLTFDFPNPPQGLPAIDPAGQWTVMISDSNLNIKSCKLTALADDHRLHMQNSLGMVSPKVNSPLPIKVNLDWLGEPINEATVDVFIYPSDNDLGDVLANAAAVKLTSSPDPASPGNQKFDELWANDSTFRELLKRSENMVTLSRTADGTYEGTYNGINVSGAYKMLVRIKGANPKAGEILRLLGKSFYSSFNGVDIEASGITTQLVNGQLILTFKPMSNANAKGKKFLIGPAMGTAFALTNNGIKIDSVVDHQDGSYTITFSGNVSDTTTLQLLGQNIYTGKLADIGKSDSSFIGKIKKWLESIGLPGWSLWVILLLLLLILIWLFRRKK